MAQQRRFAFELRRCHVQHGKDFGWHCGQKGRTSMTAGLFNMPDWYDSNFGSRKENNPSPGAILPST
jgi:hypothetical protein